MNTRSTVADADKQQIPALFWFNPLLIASNGTDSRVGSLTADWEVLAHGHRL